MLKHFLYLQVEEAERRVAEVSYIKNYSKEYFLSKSDESKIKSFELEHPRFSKLIEGNDRFKLEHFKYDYNLLILVLFI